MVWFGKPHPSLSRWVKEYWSWENVSSDDLPWIFPSYEPELVLHWGTPPVVVREDLSEVPLTRIHWVGPQTKRWKIKSETTLHLVSVRFFPGALYERFSISGEELVNEFEDAAARFSSDVDFPLPSMEPSLLTESLNSLILSMWEKRSEVPDYAKLALVAFMRGETKIDSLAERLRISRKQLNRKFKEIYGLSPKDFKGMHRMLNLIRDPSHYKDRNAKLRLTDLAYQSDYSDQSHLIHDFKSVSGQLPKEWFEFYYKMSHFYNYDLSS